MCVIVLQIYSDDLEANCKPTNGSLSYSMCMPNKNNLYYRFQIRAMMITQSVEIHMIMLVLLFLFVLFFKLFINAFGCSAVVIPFVWDRESTAVITRLKDVLDYLSL